MVCSATVAPLPRALASGLHPLVWLLPAALMEGLRKGRASLCGSG